MPNQSIKNMQTKKKKMRKHFHEVRVNERDFINWANTKFVDNYYSDKAIKESEKGFG